MVLCLSMKEQSIIYFYYCNDNYFENHWFLKGVIRFFITLSYMICTFEEFGAGFFFFQDWIVGILGGEDLSGEVIDIFLVELLFLEKFVVEI